MILFCLKLADSPSTSAFHFSVTVSLKRVNTVITLASWFMVLAFSSELLALLN